MHWHGNNFYEANETTGTSHTIQSIGLMEKAQQHHGLYQESDEQSIWKYMKVKEKQNLKLKKLGTHPIKRKRTDQDQIIKNTSLP